MDLVSLDMQSLRSTARFTVIEFQQDGILTNILVKDLTRILSMPIYQKPSHPKTLIIHGKHSRNLISKIIKTSEFTYKVIIGYDNPELPFAPPLV